MLRIENTIRRPYLVDKFTVRYKTDDPELQKFLAIVTKYQLQADGNNSTEECHQILDGPYDFLGWTDVHLLNGYRDATRHIENCWMTCIFEACYTESGDTQSTFYAAVEGSLRVQGDDYSRKEGHAGMLDIAKDWGWWPGDLGINCTSADYRGMTILFDFNDKWQDVLSRCKSYAPAIWHTFGSNYRDPLYQVPPK